MVREGAVEHSRLRTAIGVAEVEVEPLSSPSLPVLCSSSSPSNLRTSWGFGLEQDSRFGFTQVSWSRTASVRPKDVILAVNGRPVMSESKEEIVRLIEQTAEGGEKEKEEEGGEDDEGTEVVEVKCHSKPPLRLTLDTRRSWPATLLSRHSGGGEKGSRSRWWGRRLLCLLEGFDTALLDAQVSPPTKLVCNAAGMALLLPVLESCFTALRGLSSRFGPLLVPNPALHLFEAAWTALYLCCPCLLLASRLLHHHGLHAHSSTLLRRLSSLLRLLDTALFVPIAVTSLTIATTGLTLPSMTTEAQLEQELQQLITHLLLLIIVPFFMGWYLRRFACFASAYADLLSDGRPQRLALFMPLSSHFGEDPEQFKALRAFGY